MSKKTINILFFVLLCIPLFANLGYSPIQLWDESRLATNAMEMKLNGQFLVTHFEGVPDMWNTKPPLLIWLQILSLQFFGYNEFAIRFPSAFAALLTCLVLWRFCAIKLQKTALGVFSAFVLVTTNGFIHNHVSRTGDYEALLILFTTLQCIFFYLFINEGKTKWLYAFFASIVLAVLTKSVAGMFFLPAFLIYAITNKKIISTLKNVHFYIAFLLFLACVLGYYFARELQNPGFLHAVWNNEIGGRLSVAQENNSQPWWFYLDQIQGGQLSIWFYLIPFGICFGWTNKNIQLKSFAILTTIVVVSFLTIISISQTKLKWYDAPVFPLTAILVAIAINYIWEKRTFNFSNNNKKTALRISLIVLMVISITAYVLIVDKVLNIASSKSKLELYETQMFLKNSTKNNIDLNNHIFIYDQYPGPLYFYTLILQTQGVKIKVTNKAYEFKPNDLVLFYENNIQEYMQENYTLTLMNKYKQFSVYKINEKKPKHNLVQ